MLIAAHSVRYL